MPAISLKGGKLDVSASNVDEYYIAFLARHSSIGEKGKMNRRLHFFGTGTFLASVAVGVMARNVGIIVSGLMIAITAITLGHVIYDKDSQICLFHKPKWSIICLWRYFKDTINNNYEGL